MSKQWLDGWRYAAWLVKKHPTEAREACRTRRPEYDHTDHEHGYTAALCAAYGG